MLPRFRFFVPAAALLVVAAFGSTGCGSNAGCPELCDAQKRCFDDDYDVAACSESCQSLVDENEDYAAAVEDRASCFEDATCAEIEQGECAGDGE